MSSWLFPLFGQVATAKLTGELRECKTIRMTDLDVNADHSMMRPAEKMLIILFAGILLISCASRATNRQWLPSDQVQCSRRKRSQTLPMTAQPVSVTAL